MRTLAKDWGKKNPPRKIGGSSATAKTPEAVLGPASRVAVLATGDDTTPRPPRWTARVTERGGFFFFGPRLRHFATL